MYPVPEILVEKKSLKVSVWNLDAGNPESTVILKDNSLNLRHWNPILQKVKFSEACFLKITGIWICGLDFRTCVWYMDTCSDFRHHVCLKLKVQILGKFRIQTCTVRVLHLYPECTNPDHVLSRTLISWMIPTCCEVDPATLEGCISDRLRLRGFPDSELQYSGLWPVGIDVVR